jgi:hypothetical protein
MECKLRIPCKAADVSRTDLLVEARSHYSGPIQLGPGKEKVFAGEYEIFNTEDSSILITPQNFSLLRPGAAITMAMVIGRYEKGEKDQCPKPGCKSKMHVKSNAGGFIW